MRNTAYISSYLHWDQTNKLRLFLLLVKRFVSNQKIHGAVNGYLSSYSWVMLVFHFLLRLQLIPTMELITNSKINSNINNIQDTLSFGFILNDNNNDNRSIPLFSNLSNISITHLFTLFLYYYTHEIDINSDVITLRGNGEVKF